ncbi:MAG: FABP family protein [Actinomycetota bacterium]
MTSAPPLHPDIGSLGFLVGTWVGEGKGDYPTIEPFGYGEEIDFWHIGKPWIGYRQRTWALDGRRPLHAEMGYWRRAEDDRVELVLAHPTGVAEIEEGIVEGEHIALRSTSVAKTSTAKPVSALTRSIAVSGDVMTYTLEMAAVGKPLTHHLSATLHRQ